MNVPDMIIGTLIGLFFGFLTGWIAGGDGC